jgi:hypothetical protein
MTGAKATATDSLGEAFTTAEAAAHADFSAWLGPDEHASKTRADSARAMPSRVVTDDNLIASIMHPPIRSGSPSLTTDRYPEDVTHPDEPRHLGL